MAFCSEMVFKSSVLGSVTSDTHTSVLSLMLNHLPFNYDCVDGQWSRPSMWPQLKSEEKVLQKLCDGWEALEEPHLGTLQDGLYQQIWDGLVVWWIIDKNVISWHTFRINCYLYCIIVMLKMHFQQQIIPL